MLRPRSREALGSVPALSYQPTSPERRLAQLLDALAGKKRLLVLTHDNPDPDCIASGWALARVVKKSRVVPVAFAYAGIIGRSENRTLTEVLKVPIRPLDEVDLARFDAFALVDSQPETGNNSLPQGVLPTVVIDHHPCREKTREVPYYDVREEYGATASMLSEYLEAADVRVDRRLATALFYAIKSETQNLGRESSRADFRAFAKFFPLVDNIALSRIEHPPIPRAYFQMFDQAIAGTQTHGRVAVSRLGVVDNPDMVAQFADLLVRMEGVRWVFAMGRFEQDVLVSVRTGLAHANAGRVVQQVVGRLGKAGGHGMMAGGKVQGGATTRSRAEETERVLVARVLKILKASPKGEPLVLGSALAGC